MNDIIQSNNMIPLSGGDNAMSNAENSKAIMEVIASLKVAKMFPRNENDAMDKILKDCTRPGLADAALYEYKKGTSIVTGPSIRLAEALKRVWGNIESGWRELERRGDSSIVQAYAWDKETNVREERTFTVKQVRVKAIWANGKNTGRKEITPLEDERDIYENNANQAARRVRACILALIPGDIIDAAVAQCEATMAANEKVTTESIAQLVEAFSKFKVTKEMLAEYTGRNLTPEALSAAMMVKLRNVYKSIKDGVGAVDEYFVILPEPKDDKPEAAKEAAADGKKNLEDFKAKNAQPQQQQDLLKGE